MRRPLLCLAGLLLTAPLVATAACTGDCDEDGRVTAGELVQAIDVVLDREPLSVCRTIDRDGNGRGTVDELVAAVEGALNECVAVRPTASPTATPDPDCGDGTVTGLEECDDGNRIDGDGCTSSCQLEPDGDVCAGVAPHPGVAPRSVLLASGLDQPVHISAPSLDPRRVFVVEQSGRIRVLRDSALLPEPFLAIEDRVSCCGERGLLSLAFHPEYESNGRFFVDYTNRDGATVIARYRITDAEHADRASEKILLTIAQPYPNHNGGQLAFGPDGYLYVGMGDGGSGGDPQENGQNDETLLGKLLRLDVDVESPPYYGVPSSNPGVDLGRPLGLIWAKGLRNPWRFSFDRGSGDLYIADVGQDRIEEVDVQPAGSAGGRNYGWDVFEGSLCFEPDPFPTCPDPPTGFTMPVLEYDHDEGCSITGGFVYRGCALPDLHGAYFYADFCSSFIRSFHLANAVATDRRDWTGPFAPSGGETIRSITSFGEDARGELYIADQRGKIFEIVPSP